MYKWFLRGVVFYILPLLFGFYVCSVARAYEVNVDLTSSSGICASSSVQASNVAYNAVDGIATTFWRANTAAPAWWSYDFGVGVSYPIDKVTFSSWGGSFDSFDILGSQDGLTFTTLFSGNMPVTDVVQVYSFTNSISYRFVRVQINTDRGGLPALPEVELMVTSLSSTPTPTPTSSPPISTPTPTSTPSTGSVTSSFGGVVYGRVVDKFKSPLSEIKVQYSTLGDDYLGVNPVLTDNDGYYYFEDVDTQFGCGLVMTAKRYGTITLNYDGTVKDSVVRVPDEMLIRGNSDKFTLSGTVKDLYSSPVGHARVRVKSSGEPCIVYTDSLGTFSVSDLFIGTHTVTVKHSGYYVGRVKYSNTDGLVGSVDILLQEK